MKKLILTLSLLALAAPGATAGVLKDNAGCGLGTLFFDAVGLSNGGWLLQSTADYSNELFSNTLTMTTGTLNCKGRINKVVTNEVYEFITANMDNLAKDVAMGGGETINSLAAMLSVKDVDAFGSTLQANFADIFPDAQVQSDAVANKIVALS